MNKKSLLCLLLALALCLSGLVCAAAEEEAADVKIYQLGDQMEDFTFTAYDGQTYTLSEMLQEKELVLINFWATWCGPCRMEFPYMEEAYQEYKDRIGLVAMAVWEEDDVTTDTLREYAETNGLTFPMGFGVNSLEDSFQVQGIPTSVVVDRFGTICFVEAGAQTSTDNFRRLFDVFLGDEYTESVLLADGIPAKVPDVAPTDPAELAAALNVEGGELAFTNPTDEYNWPMVVKTEGDRTYVTTTNMTQSKSTSAVEFAVTAAEGDVLTLDFAISSEAGYDFLTITVNGEVVKQYSGIRDWKTFTYAFPAAGDYAVTLAYVKDEASDDGDDAACFDNVRVVSGDEAAELLASLPVYPHAEANTLTLVNEDAKQILIDDPSGLLASSFGDATYYVVPGDTAHFKATLAEGADPDSATFYNYFDGASYVLSDCVDGDAYAFSCGIDSMETTGASYCYATLTVGDEVIYVVFFNSEQNVNTFFYRNFTDEDGNPTATWEYADGSAHTTDELAVAPEVEEESEEEDTVVPNSEAPEGMATYSLFFFDPEGNPVPGVIANICDDTSCQPMTSNENGLIAFTYPAFAYHVQVIEVPEGYVYDTSKELWLTEEGGITIFMLDKE